MTISPDGTENDMPLSISDAANEYASATTSEEPDEGQPEEEDALTEDAVDDELLADEAGEGDEGDPEDEGQAENEDDTQSDQGRFVSPNGKVRMPDGSVVPVSELIDGNLRDRDYRQKTMAHAEAVKAFDAQSKAVKQQVQQIEEQRAYMAQLLQSIVPKPPDPNRINTDPLTYMQEEASYKYWANHLHALADQQQQAQQARQAEVEQERRQRIEREWSTLLEKASDLRDQARLESFVSDIDRISPVWGFNPQEVKDQLVMDHRLALVLRDAMKYRKIQANKTKVAAKVDGRPPVQRGGNRLDPARAQARSSRAAMERLNQSGRLADGVAALLAIEGKG